MYVFLTKLTIIGFLGGAVVLLWFLLLRPLGRWMGLIQVGPLQNFAYREVAKNQQEKLWESHEIHQRNRRNNFLNDLYKDR